MKNIYNIFYVGILLFGMINLTACGDDEEFYDFPGDPYNRVYLMDESTSYQITQTPVTSVYNMEFKTIVKCTQPASENIKATVEIDNSLIEAYNEEYETEYEAIPAAALLLHHMNLTIPAGTMASMDTLHIALSEDLNVISTLRNENGYLIPLRVTTAEGGNSQVSTNLFCIYLTVEVNITDNIHIGASESSLTGTLVADQSGWSVTINNTSTVSTNPIEAILDGDATTYCTIRNTTEEIIMNINMGKPYTFDGIRFYYAQSNYWGQITTTGSFSNGMTIETSNDGITWSSELGGTLTGTVQFCVFYAPVTAQYIRIVRPQSTSYLYAGVFNVYAK